MHQENQRYIYIHIYGVYTHTHTMEYYSAIKRTKFCHLKELGEHYSKWNKSDRERQILYDITYVESKKYSKLVNITKKRVGA